MLEEFEKEIKTSKDNFYLLNTIGIGLFLIYSLFEFCSFLKFIFQHFLIITKTDAQTILWLSELIAFILFVILFSYLFNYFYDFKNKASKKLLISCVAAFFLIIILQFLFSYLGVSYLYENYSSAYDFYYDNIDGYYQLNIITTSIPIIEYIIIAYFFISKRKLKIN
ncbi:hypothetical protein LG651_03755 [Tamlana sp. 62-3]|uniref:Uncharacterized protein n=1 Tax=Neotamlana sargassicola TaxID=2883125 RepID=A0A9X1I6M9_9FLAO|nr:hypothetical protein [Tamlana sargassicola]MCB4807354.1 hypothetical protein [Tamlana sargassicola]